MGVVEGAALRFYEVSFVAPSSLPQSALHRHQSGGRLRIHGHSFRHSLTHPLATQNLACQVWRIPGRGIHLIASYARQGLVCSGPKGSEGVVLPLYALLCMHTITQDDACRQCPECLFRPAISPPFYCSSSFGCNTDGCLLFCWCS